MAHKAEDFQGLVPLRITVLGTKGSGKTSLVSSFVNSYCPTVYAATEAATMHYRTLQLGGLNVLAELEDTPGWTGVPEDGQLARMAGQKARQAAKRSLDREGEASAPLSMFDPPHGSSANEPITTNRMGFVVVFDATDEDSLAAAKHIWHLLEDSQASRGEESTRHGKPVVLLLANKMDAPGAASSHALQEARRFKVEYELGNQYAEVSAQELKKAKAIFRKVLQTVIDEETLWEDSLRMMRGSGSPGSAASKSLAHSATETLNSVYAAAAGGNQECALQ